MNFETPCKKGVFFTLKTKPRYKYLGQKWGRILAFYNLIKYYNVSCQFANLHIDKA